MKEVWVLLNGGHPVGVFPDRTQAYEVGAIIVRNKYKEYQGRTQMGVPPPDPSHLLPWWNSHQVFPDERVNVIPVPWRDRLEELKNARKLG